MGICNLSNLLRTATIAAAMVVTSSLWAQNNEITISHYFTGELGLKAFKEQIARFEKDTGKTLRDSPVGHEDFKTDILVRASGNSLPDVFSYWAGARVQFIVDSGSLTPIDDMWESSGLDDIVAKSIANSATLYDGKRYLVPFNYHYAGIFYNTSVLAEAGITQTPKSWDDFMGMAKTLKDKGITPIALGSKDRWPAQFWFDYLLLGSAGPDYRAKLMNGTARYDDPQVKTAMALWKDLTDAEFFVPNANADSWTDAADKVARGDAAMTLMGTWITGYWNGLGLEPDKDYNFFAFPVIDESIATSVVGPVDGLVISSDGENPEGAKEFLSYMMSNTDVQRDWTNANGAVSANVNVDPSSYNAVIQQVVSTIGAADNFAFNYDLATPPPVAEVGLSMFSQFMDDPSQVDAILTQVADEASAAFKE